MKQITKATVLKQGNKTYPAIEVEQGIVWVDKDAEIKLDYNIYSTLYGIGKISRDYGGVDGERNRPLIAEFINSQQTYHRNGVWQRGKYEDVSAHNCKKIIAATFDLEGVHKIELEDEVEQLANEAWESEGYTLMDSEGEYQSNLQEVEGYFFTEEELKKLLQDYTDRIVENAKAIVSSNGEWVSSHVDAKVINSSITSQLEPFIKEIL